MPIVVADVALGAALVVAIALAAVRSSAARSSSRGRTIGWLLIAVPLPLAVGMELFFSVSRAVTEAAFVTGVVAFGVGALMVLRRGDEKDERREGDSGDPPWWPDFERDFNRYAQSRRSERMSRS